MSGKRQGKKSYFTAEENLVLRSCLRRLQSEGKLNEIQLGEALNMTQQNASRLLAGGGMGRNTANALAKRLGYTDVERLLTEHASDGIGADRESDGEDAARVARRLGFEEPAIAAVLVRYAGERGRQVKWWLTKFGNEETELAADAAKRPEPPKPKPAARKRR